MLGLNESTIENWAIELLQAQGYTHILGTDLAPDTTNDERARYEDVVLQERLREAVRRLNPNIPAPLQEEAIREVLTIASPEVRANNEAFHRLLTEGIPVTHHAAGESRGDRVRLVDFSSVDNNDFVVVNQLTVRGAQQTKRMDLVLYINGLPLVLIELKNATSETATVQTAFQQIQTYIETIPQLFMFNAFSIISDGLEARAGALGASFSRFMAWKSADGVAEASHLQSQLEVLIGGMLNRETLLDLIAHFVVFEEYAQTDAATGQIRIEKVKKIAAYHQYYAVNKAVVSTLRAASAVGAVFGANELLGRPFTRLQLIDFAMNGEEVASGSRHADNVAAKIGNRAAADRRADGEAALAAGGPAMTVS